MSELRRAALVYESLLLVHKVEYTDEHELKNFFY